MQKNQYLLIEDVDGLGRSGDIVENIKPGFLRNFLLPKRKVTKAGTNTLKRQAMLQVERAKQSKIDLEESMKLAEALKGITLEMEVEVNPEGDMYGSVSVVEILHLLEEKNFPLDRKMIRLGGPIKKLGEHVIPLKLKEELDASVMLKVNPKGGPIKKEEKTEPPVTEEKNESIEEDTKESSE